MAPCNGTTSTPPKLVITLPPTIAHCNATLRWRPAMAPRPLHPAMAPWCHVQSAKVVRRPSPPIGSKNPYSYRYLGKNKMWWDRRWKLFFLQKFLETRRLHPRKPTWNLKMMVFHRNLLFQGLIFRFHIKLRGSTQIGDLAYPRWHLYDSSARLHNGSHVVSSSLQLQLSNEPKVLDGHLEKNSPGWFPGWFF